jgi:hypothetical protein
MVTFIVCARKCGISNVNGANYFVFIGKPAKFNVLFCSMN